MRILLFILVLLSPIRVLAALPVATTPSSGGSPMDAIMSEDLIRSLKDPFQAPPISNALAAFTPSDLELYRTGDFRLNGVITGPKKVRAMLSAPNNKTYFIKVGDAIGVRNGKVSQITAESVKITEYVMDERGKRIPEVVELKIGGDMDASRERTGE